ncbi:probable peptidoglycan muropeptide transporter SLC46 isoform X2 [Panulirus ornatus]|uniref:probable peptidoglycan muropeptide transporter SLC46 isoform X2 n=1 Tax=Panulirus ornatus TaxID=150431 RepID=UPI003A874FA8
MMRDQQRQESHKRLGGWWSRVINVMKGVTVEPLMLLDGLAFSNMHVYIENLQMDRVCRVSSGFSQQVCDNLRSEPAASVHVQQRYSVFALYNGIIAAALPLFFILFMGAWSDKYGRKVPLVAVQVGHVLHAAGYLLASLAPWWPAEVLLLVTLLDTLGGGTVSFLTAANSYIGDVSSEESRTSRVGLANSIWFLGGPAGTLMGTYIYSQGGYLPLFATSLTLSVMAVVYVVVFLPESHGPFAKTADQEAPGHKAQVELRESVAAVYGLEMKATPIHNAHHTRPTFSTMIKDFFNPRRILDSFKATLRKREGNTRALVLTLIFTSLLRRLTRSPYVFAFTRHVLGWEATDYSLWVTYKNLMATTGSLVAVPLLSGRLRVSDNLLAMVGAMSGVLEYVVYGAVSDIRSYLIWIAPVAALLLNSCTIAQRAMMTKFIANDEIGKVSAVLGALDGMMPMVNSALYTAVYHASVSSFPAAHFFLGASASAFMIVFFCIIMGADKAGQYDVEGAKPSVAPGPVTNKSLVMRSNSCWLATDTLALALSIPDPHVLPRHHNVHQQTHPQSPPSHGFAAKTNLVSDSNDRPHKLVFSLKSSLRGLMKPEEASAQAPATLYKPDTGLKVSDLFVNINRILMEVVSPKNNPESRDISDNPDDKVAKIEKTLPPV